MGINIRNINNYSAVIETDTGIYEVGDNFKGSFFIKQQNGATLAYRETLEEGMNYVINEL